MQCNVENALRKEMWQLAFMTHVSKRRLESLIVAVAVAVVFVVVVENA